MELNWLVEPNTYIGFFALLILEIVLGVDNLVFVTIISNKTKPQNQDRARVIGLSLAIFIRLMMLAVASYIISLSKPLFSIGAFSISGKNILMILGGFFLIYKATTELHEKIDEKTQYTDNYFSQTKYTPIGVVIAQIALIDAIFSLDSIITAVGMVEHIIIAMIAVTIAVIIMIIGSKYLANFINQHPTVVMLCLGFLLMIGFALILEGFHMPIPKGYIYAAIVFSIIIETLNQISSKNKRENTYTSASWRRRTVDSVLGMMGIRESVLASATKHGELIEDQSIFEDNEKNMIRSVLTLAERPIEGIMTPRREIAKLNISKPIEEQRKTLCETPNTRLIVVGESGIEEPLGYINKKDVLAKLLKNEKFDIKNLIKQPLVIPNTATVLSALELIRNSKTDIGLVVDEFGTVLGLITIKDIIETIVGKFPEEYEQFKTPAIQTNEDQSITVDGSIEYELLTQILNLPPFPTNAEFHSVAGLIMEEMEQIPEVGDSINFYGYIFKVLEKEGQKIKRVNIKSIDKAF